MTYAESLKQNLQGPLALPPDAVEWLLDLWNAIQVLDDAADGDTPERPDVSRAVWSLLIGMQANPFYSQNAKTLSPIVALQILKWEAADKVEREGKADAKSYVWRAGYYDVVLQVAHLCHGYPTSLEAGPIVMAMYGESLADYLGEFA